MRWYLVVVLGLFVLLLQEQALMPQVALLPQSTSVKLRLEIEIQGVLSMTEKSATITNKETIFEYVKDPDAPQPSGVKVGVMAGGWVRIREVDKVWVLDLDDNLKKTAKALHGKEIVLTGKCLLVGVKSQASTSKTPPSIGSKTVQGVRGNPPMEMPVILPEGFATSVQSQLLLDDHVTVISLKAVK
jgi:hypothetical protein